MKKTLFAYIIGLMMIFSFSSCETAVYATTQDDIYVESKQDVVHSTVDFDIVIRYGTPFYHDGSLIYYLYNGLYYYPFYYNSYWYVRAYRRPFAHLNYRPYFRPHRYDYRLSRGYRPQHNWYRPQPRPNYRQPSRNVPNVRHSSPNVHHSTPNVRQNGAHSAPRPHIQNRSVNRSRNFGGASQGRRR